MKELRQAKEWSSAYVWSGCIESLDPKKNRATKVKTTKQNMYLQYFVKTWKSSYL